MNEKVECKRIILKPLTPEEMGRIAEGSQDFLEPSMLSAEILAAVAYKRELLRRTPPEAHPWITYWRMEEKESGRGIGVIGGKSLPDAQGYVEIGYAVAKEDRNRGFMTEALCGFLDWLYAYPFCSGASLLIRKENAPSLRVAEKCGFSYAGMEEGYRAYRYSFEPC